MLTDHVVFCISNRLFIAMYLICGKHFISVTCLLLGVAIFTNSSVYTVNAQTLILKWAEICLSCDKCVLLMGKKVVHK